MMEVSRGRRMAAEVSAAADDAVVDLALGLLRGAARKSALARVLADPGAAALLQAIERGGERARARGEAARLVQGSGGHGVAGASVRTLLHAIFRGARPVVAAAAAAAAIAVVVWMRGVQPMPVVLHSLPGAEDRIVLRSTSRPAWSDLDRGLDAYERGDWVNAAAILGRASASGGEDVFRRVYRANALARLGRHAEVLAELESIHEESIPDPWGMETAWTRYAALSALGRRPEADALLQWMAAQPGAVGDRARVAASRDPRDDGPRLP